MPRTNKTLSRNKPKAPPSPAAASRHPGTAQADLQARINEIRARQRNEGNFDCFATASGGYCDQADCLFRSECMSLAQKEC